MTGKELIIQILEDGYENHKVVTNVQEAALACGVGTETLKALVAKGDVILTTLFWIPPEFGENKEEKHEQQD